SPIYLQALMKGLPDAEVQSAPPPAAPDGAPARTRKNKSKPSKNAPRFDLSAELKRVAGVDLTRIDGIQVNTIQTVITEAGLDMSSWPSEHHFVSWIGIVSAQRCQRREDPEEEDAQGGLALGHRAAHGGHYATRKREL